MRKSPASTRRRSHLRLVDGTSGRMPATTAQILGFPAAAAFKDMSETERQRRVRILLQQADTIGSIAVEVLALDQPALIARIDDDRAGDLFEMFLGASDAVRISLQALTDVIGAAHARVAVAVAASDAGRLEQIEPGD